MFGFFLGYWGGWLGKANQLFGFTPPTKDEIKWCHKDLVKAHNGKPCLTKMTARDRSLFGLGVHRGYTLFKNKV